MVSTSKVRLCSSENLFRLECKKRRSFAMRTTIRSMPSLFRVRTISTVSICLFLRGCWPIRIKWRNYWTSSVVNSCPTMNWRKLPKKLNSHRSWFSSRRRPLICSIQLGRVISSESAPVKVFNCHWIPLNWRHSIWSSLVPIIGKTQWISSVLMLGQQITFSWSPNSREMKIFVGLSISCPYVSFTDRRARALLLSASVVV